MGDNTNFSQSPLAASVDIGIVGAGAMGAGIAQVAAIAGHRVLLYDARPGAAADAASRVVSSVEKLVAKGRASQEQAVAVQSALQPVDALARLRGCGLVIEAIVEELDAKRTLFRSLEEIVGADALLATNTSSLSVTAIASALSTPQRLLGMHFFNPAPLMPLVEIISGAATSHAAAQTLYATAKAWGKTPVFARSTPGFIVNRVARPFYAESLRLLTEGASDCATIDTILRESGGFRMGPFELMDLIGHDVNYAVTRAVFDAFHGDTRFTPSLLQLELIHAGFLGRKAGRGFYQYGEDVSVPAPSTHAPAPLPRDIRMYSGTPLADAIVTRLTTAGVTVTTLEQCHDNLIAEGDDFVLYASDGRTATARAAETGISDTLVADLALDASSVTRLAIAKADQCSASAVSACAGLLQAAGYSVSVIDDVPGMLVLRTVAMLANEAADAVHQGVCTASECDLAMRKGVNYPLGPLEWADRIGVRKIVHALDNIRNFYGEERYRVSPLLRRKALAGALLRNDLDTNTSGRGAS